jgi:uncharacterized protein YjeT (DUF2065 family)
MNWSDLLAAIALYLILEGILPFLSPQWMKRIMASFVSMADNSLRVWGLVSMGAGLALLYFVRA